MKAHVTAVSSSSTHSFSKPNQSSIKLIVGEGVEGDAHRGTKVQHLFVMRHNPDQPNLRQVHLMHSELHEELREAGFDVTPGQMGENVTTRGIDILGLPTGTRLRLGETRSDRDHRPAQSVRAARSDPARPQVSRARPR